MPCEMKTINPTAEHGKRDKKHEVERQGEGGEETEMATEFR